MIGSCTGSGVLPVLAPQFAALTRKHLVPAAQLAVHAGGHTATLDAGELEYRGGSGVSSDAAFPAGSLTKAFTATLAMILVADGDLDLAAPIGEHLPGLAELGDEITLHHLLSHTSGLAAGPDSEDVSGLSTHHYVTEYCQRRNRLLPPGLRFSYSNLGFVLIGALIEAVTGMPWPEAVASILLRPLGIEPAFVCRPGARPPRSHPTRPVPASPGSTCTGSARPVATGHSTNPAAGRVRPVRQSLAAVEAPAGGLAVSATDLVTLGLLHLAPGRPGLLPTATADRMRCRIAGADPFGLADGWGLGLSVYQGQDGEWVGHDGNADGTSCYLRIDPAGGRIVAFCANANSGAALWQDLVGRLAHAGIEVPVGRCGEWTPSSAAVPAPTGCAGTYLNGDCEFQVMARHNRLYLSADGSAHTPLSLYPDLTFSFTDPNSGRQVLGGRFTCDPRTGRIDGLQMDGRLARRGVLSTPMARTALTA